MDVSLKNRTPVTAKLDEIRSALAAGCDVVLSAPPGSGKTTCVPPALLDEPWLAGKRIVMLEPRRLAARNCATWIARQRGEAPGGTVGYQVRLERCIGPATRLEIITEGLLSQRIMSDPELSEVGLVIFDEFHERSLQCDLAFALALDVKRALRPDLRIMVMSATLDIDEIVPHLRLTGASPTVVRAEGRMFPVETRYLGDCSMVAAVNRALHETAGDILCFLPGEGEIRRALSALPAEINALPLYGSLPKSEQDAVFRPSNRRRVILSTAVAETSVTIDGITTVIDSGLMRISRFSPSTGMSGLVTLPVTLDRAEQRRGRAGRVCAGVCYRLWSEASEASRPRKMMPEILDADLTHLVLSSYAWGAVNRTDLPWLTSPPASAWEQAVGLLTELGAIEGRSLTAKGKAMAEMSLHPRLATMLLGCAGDSDDAFARACRLAAILEEGVRGRETDIRFVPTNSRIDALAKRFQHYRSAAKSAKAQRAFAIDCPLALAYPDRIARNRGNGTFQMTSGRGAFLDMDDPLAKEPFIVCCELDDRQGDAKIFLAMPMAAAEIESLFADKITETLICDWNRREERVSTVLRRTLGRMPLKEIAVNPSDFQKNSAFSAFSANDWDNRRIQALLVGIRDKGVENLPCWTKETLQLKARVDFLHRIFGDDWPSVDDAAILAQLPAFLGGATKWRDLEKLDLHLIIDAILAAAGHDRRELERLAPARMEVPSGSRMTVHYEGDEPTVEVRLQECFGLMETPKVAGGRVPVVMTLLSPAQRPIQVTKDLAGFWRGGYQLVRKDMRGRYPKHYWPEDPLTAVATSRVRPK